MDELLLVEARLPRSLAALAWPPGRLWDEWRKGRRASFVSPLRLYLLAAVPFFLLFTGHRDDPGVGERLLQDLVILNYFTPDERTAQAFGDPVLLGPLPADRWGDSLARVEWRNEFQRLQAERLARQAEVDRSIEAGVRNVFELLPIAVGLLMVPWLALLLGLDRRSRDRFSSLLVASLHVHAVGYILAVFGWIFDLGLVIGAAGAALYLGIASYRVTGDSAPDAAARTVWTPALYGLGFLLAYVVLVEALTSLAPGWVFGG